MGRMRIKTGKEAGRLRGRDAWQGEGGNPRTEQRGQIVMFDNVAKTRHTFDVAERDQGIRDHATYAPDGVADRLNPLQQMGRPLEPSLLMAKLHLCNPNFIFEPAIAHPGYTGIYIEQDGYNIKTMVSGRYKRYICSFDHTAPLPEFSIMGARTEDRPNADGSITTGKIKHAYEKTRGWRTVVAKLVAAGYITEPDVIKHFAPQLGRSSELWQKKITPPITLT